MNTNPTTTCEAQLAGRVAVLLPEVDRAVRLELLGVMDPDDMRASLAFLISQYPQAFDRALVRDAKLIERLRDRLDEEQEVGLEPYCARCGAGIGIFVTAGPDYHHYRNGENGIEIYAVDDHMPAVSWVPAGAR